MKEKKVTVHLPLQFFAEGDSSTSTPTDGATLPVSGTEPPAQPSFDDMLKANKEMQSEFDKRVAKAQETALAKAKTVWEAQAKAEQEEAARLAKMNAEEKAMHEREKQEKVLAEREAAVTKRELMAEASAQLTEKGLPVGLSACLDYTNADTCKSSMEAVEKAFNQAVEDKVNDRLRGTPPKAPQGGNEPAINSLYGAVAYEFKNGGI